MAGGQRFGLHGGKTRNLAVEFEHYNEQHSHSAEIPFAARVQAHDRFINSNVRRCPEVQGQIQAM